MISRGSTYTNCGLETDYRIWQKRFANCHCKYVYLWSNFFSMCPLWVGVISEQSFPFSSSFSKAVSSAKGRQDGQRLSDQLSSTWWLFTYLLRPGNGDTIGNDLVTNLPLWKMFRPRTETYLAPFIHRPQRGGYWRLYRLGMEDQFVFYLDSRE